MPVVHRQVFPCRRSNGDGEQSDIVKTKKESFPGKENIFLKSHQGMQASSP